MTQIDKYLITLKQMSSFLVVKQPAKMAEYNAAVYGLEKYLRVQGALIEMLTKEFNEKMGRGL